MARRLVMAHYLRCWLGVLFRPRSWSTRASTGNPPETILYLWTIACCYNNSMPRRKLRLRGRPRRGSPWRPRRPMALVPQSLGLAWRVLHSLSTADPPGTPFTAPPGSSATQHPSTSQGQPRENCTLQTHFMVSNFRTSYPSSMV
jgi:hypothetical protein